MQLTPDDPKLTAYALGELDAGERAAVEAALARSPECRRAVAEIRALGTELTTALAADTATALDALPSLAPSGGEGRGEGVPRDAQSVAAARNSREGLSALSAIGKGTSIDSVCLSPSPQPSPPVGAREKSGADAPGAGKVIFLPWRQWRTVGLAAAAAVAVGFFVTKVWQREPIPLSNSTPGHTSKPLPKPTELEIMLGQYFTVAGVNTLSNNATRFSLDERTQKLTVQGQTNDLEIVQMALELIGGSRLERNQPNASATGFASQLYAIPNLLDFSNGLASVVSSPITASVGISSSTGGLGGQGAQSVFMAGNVATLKDTATPSFRLNNSVAAVGGVHAGSAVRLDEGLARGTGGGGAIGSTILPGALSFSSATYSVAENAPSATITVTRTGGALGQASVQFSTANGTTDRYYAGIAPGSAPSEGNRTYWAYQPDTRSTAAYPRYVENPFTLVASEPLSTFSTDVDTASYANVRRFLNQNQLPPRDAVRLEELLNYFTYDYAPPTGPHPFAAHIEVAGCPWAPEHRLVRVGLKGRELKADKRPPSNFVFLIDVSGSMSPAVRLPLIKESLRQLVKRMTEDDRVAMVVYASSSGTVLESTSAVHKERILSAIDRLEAGGSTNGGEGIQRAYDLAVANFIKGGVNRVILCTDGDFNVGITDRGQLLKLIEDRAKSGVFLTTLGVGDDNFKDATLQQLADKGNGNYHYLDTVAEGHKVLVEQMNATLVTIAKDVKVQIKFNPAQAAAYRLIGYEKRILAKEDFNNDAKDAGEIGAGHTVTVLYEVVPAGVPVRGAVDPLKYQPNSQPAPAPAPVAKASGNPASKELLTLKLRYKAPDGDTSKLVEFPLTDGGAGFARASADFKFACAVAEFGMLLKDSPFKGTASFDSALELAGEGRGPDTHGYRAEFITLVAKAKELKH